MKPALLLRIAAVFTALYGIGHSLGAPWTPAKDAAALAVVHGMQSTAFIAMGTSRTYWDFYYGFGLSISVYLFTQAAVLWLVAAFAPLDAARLRPIIAAFFLSYVANAFLVWKFFFVAPLSLAVIVLLCLGAAFFSAGRARSNESAPAA